MSEKSSEVIVSNFPPRENLLNLDQLAEAAEWWMGGLGISDWTVDIKLKRGFDIEGHKGECSYTLSLQRGTIKILEPDDRPTDVDPLDMEEILVHELLHLRTAAWDLAGQAGDLGMSGKPLNSLCIEQPIQRLALLLVSLRRASTHKFSWEDA